MRDPRRDLPAAILTAIAMVVVIYILIQVVCIGTLPDLATSARPLGDAGERVFGTWGAGFISIGAALSVAANLNIVVLAASRLPFAMASRGELPKILGAVHPRFQTPHVSILFTTAMMTIVTLTGGFIYAVTVSTLARLLIYATTCGSLPVFRKRQGDNAPFRAPMGKAAAAIVIAVVMWLLATSTWREARDTGIAVAVGLATYAVCRRGSTARAA